jgi:predicted helicase
VAFQRVEPDKVGNWINLAENDWDDLIPVASKETKLAKWPSRERSIFKLFSLGVVTNRDDWVVAASAESIEERVRFLIQDYNSALAEATQPVDSVIKWTRNLKRQLKSGRPLVFQENRLKRAFYRPFVERHLYYAADLNEMLYQIPLLFGEGDETNPAFSWVAEPRANFSVLAFTGIPNKDAFMPSAGQVVARYRYTSTGERVDNVTSWAENKFQARYGKAVTKDDIFAYVYAVLHDPVYREKYAINLRREFPRLPFYPDFRQWVDWGNKLLALHIGYESVEPWPLKRLDTPDEKARAAGVAPKAVLRADRDNGIIRLDSETQLSGIPPDVWDYRLGNRSGVEWILDQYREKTPKDPTIREKFNTYRFADYKENIIDLIMRVTRVSLETVAITEAMRSARHE